MTANETNSMTSGSKSKGGRLLPILGIVLAVIAIIVFIKFCEREEPQITLANEGAPFGASRDVSFTVLDQRSGIREVSLQLVQKGKSATLYEKSFPRLNIFFEAGPERLEDSLEVKAQALGFEDGPAELVITGRDFSWWHWLRGNTTVMRYGVLIDTKPPMISVVYTPRYIMPGGSGVIVYKLSEKAAKHGVFINDLFFPGFPATDPFDGKYAAFIGLPYDLDKLDSPRIIAVDEADNQGVVVFGMILKKAHTVHDRITLSDDFLNRKLPEFAQNYPEMYGSLLEQYLFVNNKVRAANNAKIKEICKSPSPKRLWQGRFLRLPRSSRQAGFADHRSYYYQGKEVDKQVHLGMDLASTRHAPVKAANRGQVVFADYLGIYGNTVILDHGQGVFSLYGHLSQIEVKPGDLVDQDSVIGLSGATGMAGGDHLHFSMLVNGVFVSPLEWWDEHWLKLNITDFL